MVLNKIFYGWKIVATSILCYSAAPGQFATGILGLFVIPLQLEFGWSRAEIFLSITFLNLTQAIFTPFVGSLVDKHGSRKVMMPSILLFGIALAAIPLFVSDVAHLYLFYTVIGILSGGAAAVPYLRVAGAWFVKRRGLAFGLIMSGGGLGYAYSPPLVQYMIDNFGWHSGFYILAAILLLLVLPMIHFVVYNKPQDLGLLPDGETAPADNKVDAPVDEEDKVSLKELLATPLFYQLFITFILLTFCLYGLMTNLVPMLRDRGMDTSTAAFVAATVGITIIISRIVIGYLLDKFFAPRVAMICLLLSAAGTGFLAFGAAGPAAFLAAIFFGFSVGAELDLLAYLITRYFGVASFGLVYGILFAAFLAGASLGPVVFASLFGYFGSYVNILGISTCILIATSLSMFFFPKYKTV
jgi:MFS family permease